MNSNVRQLVYALVALLAALSSAGSCKPAELDVTTDLPGGDSTRSNAEEISMGAVVVGTVDTLHGDTNDWKYVTVPAVGVVTIEITFDNHDALGELVVADERGQIISTFQDEKRQLLDKITFKSSPGRYYLHIFAKEVDTDYSLSVGFSPLL